MPPELLLDTGPLVAFLNPADQYHDWAKECLSKFEVPFITCEPVVVEAFHLLARSRSGAERLMDLCRSGAVQIDFHLLDNIETIRGLLTKYRDLPMDLADACLVLMADSIENAAIITTDSDFFIYRTPSRRKLKLIAPFTE